MRRGVLFLCTANACHSQMAEGIARSLLPPELAVFSAGTSPARLDPRAVDAVAELGIDISAQRAKPVSAVPMDRVDRVITLCDDAARACPSVPGCVHEHWPIPDPTRAAGTEDEIRAAFRVARDELVSRLEWLAATLEVEPALGVIGGSGFYALPAIEDLEPVAVQTPYGRPSAPLRVGRLGGRRVVFLARHGERHHLLPGEVNARANIHALGVRRIVSVSAVGSLREAIAPGQVVLPHQLIDRTVGRPATFFGRGVVAHVSLADPVCASLADALADHADAGDVRVHRDGTYLCIEGPQFSTRAESALWRSLGADVVGMTALPEARRAREAEICYATLALPTDYDCWRTRHEEVRVADVLAILSANVERARRMLANALAEIDPAAPCACQRALDTALLTPLEALDTDARVRLHPFLARRLRDWAAEAVAS